MKTAQELASLQADGLGIVYMGVESGDDITLAAVRKGADASGMIAAGRKIRQAGIKLSITVLLGIAGQERSAIHARETGRVISAIDPEYVGALSLMLVPATPLFDDYRAGRFPLLSPEAMLHELRLMIAHTHMTGGLFHANHASNYLPLKLKMPADKADALDLIDRALRGEIALKSESMRAL
jgi:radical SAM superfamily enzyme YgiQ (UPF0313 family)